MLLESLVNGNIKVKGFFLLTLNGLISIDVLVKSVLGLMSEDDGCKQTYYNIHISYFVVEYCTLQTLKSIY